MPTLAWGFRVDFSEEKEPTDELGDNPGRLEDETAALPTLSEVNEVVVPFNLPEDASTDNSIGEHGFEEVREGGSYDVALGDNPTRSGPSAFVSRVDFVSASRERKEVLPNRQQSKNSNFSKITSLEDQPWF